MEIPNYKLLILTVATEMNDCYYRWYESISNLPVTNDVYMNIQTLGLNSSWLGGDMSRGTGGGFKINLVKEFLRNSEISDDTYILFSDCYDVVFNNTTLNTRSLIKHLETSGADIIFSAEKFCYPYPALANSYPKTDTHYTFLNSGLYFGTAKAIKEILFYGVVENTDDDQGYFTKIFLEHERLFDNLKIKLDSRCELFQSLHGEWENIIVDSNVLKNKITGTNPLCIHGNGTQVVKDQLSYIWDSINFENLNTHQIKIIKDVVVDDEYVENQNISILCFTENQNDFENVLDFYNSLEYNKSKISLKIAVKKNVNYEYSKLIDIHSVDVIFYNTNRFEVFKEVLDVESGLIVIDDISKINNPYIIQICVSSVKNFICLYNGEKGTIGNFGGFEHRIENEEVSGLFEISTFNRLPFYMSKNLVEKLRSRNIDINNFYDSLTHEVKSTFDLIYCDCRYDFRNQDFPDVQEVQDVQDNLTIFDYFNRKEEWEQKYITTFSRKRMWDMMIEPISGVISFPLFTEAFCKEFIEHSENVNQWRGDRHTYYPTTDMLLEVLGLEQIYYAVLKDYVFTAMIDFWKLDGKQWYDMVTESFVVRYSPSEQASLALHHDNSMYSVVLTLNRDFTGGGTYFGHTKQVHLGNVGEVTVHPGQITHKHAGRLVETGTRYIVVSFCSKP